MFLFAPNISASQNNTHGKYELHPLCDVTDNPEISCADGADIVGVVLTDANDPHCQHNGSCSDYSNKDNRVSTG